jgi:hypothetical protein
MKVVSSKISVMGPPDGGHQFVREEHTLSDGRVTTLDHPHTPVGIDHHKRMADRVAMLNSDPVHIENLFGKG